MLSKLPALIFLMHALPALATPEKPATFEQRMEKLEERILELEAQNALNRYRISGVLINRFESLENDHGAPGAARTRDTVRPFGMYLGMNVDFDVTKRLKVYTTFGMSKFFNNEGRNESLTQSNYATYQATETGAWGYAGSGVKVDRAYASYDFENAPLILAIGRMPTNGGPPLNQADGLPRQGTYPRFIFNAIFDGLAAIYDFSGGLPKDNSFKIRAFYQPFIFINDGDRTRQFIDGVKVTSRADQAAILAEYALTGLGFLKRLDLMYMYAWWKEFYVGYSGASPAPLGSAMTGQTEDGSDHGFYLGLEDIGHVGLNVAYTALNYQAVDSGLPDVKKNSWGHLLDINQKIERWNNLIVGYEFVRTENYFYLDDWTRLNIIPFYTLQNSLGHHLYLSMPLDEKIIGRIGYFKLNAGAGDVFQPEETDARAWYAQVRIDF